MIREYKMWSRSPESVFGMYDKKYFILRLKIILQDVNFRNSRTIIEKNQDQGVYLIKKKELGS